jgi:hypothetical protein
MSTNETNNHYPLVGGGQGRSGGEVERDSSVISTALLLVVAVALAAVLL